MHRPHRLDIEREARAPDPRQRIGLRRARVAAHLELRNGRALRRRERHLETPALAGVRALRLRLFGQRGGLQQRRARERAVGLRDQPVGDLVRGGVRRDRRRCRRLRRERRAAIGRRQRAVASHVGRSGVRFVSLQHRPERLCEIRRLLGRERRILRDQRVGRARKCIGDMPDGFACGHRLWRFAGDDRRSGQHRKRTRGACYGQRVRGSATRRGLARRPDFRNVPQHEQCSLKIVRWRRRQHFCIRGRGCSRHREARLEQHAGANEGLLHVGGRELFFQRHAQAREYRRLRRAQARGRSAASTICSASAKSGAAPLWRLAAIRTASCRARSGETSRAGASG